MSQELRVLIIEDDPDVRLGCEQAMMLADLPVEGVGSAEEGLARVKAGFPGIVVTDMRLPRADGMEVLRRCQAMDPDLPVIIITGHGDVTLAVEAMRSGAYDFIQKPFAPDLLVDVVRRALDKRALTLEVLDLQGRRVRVLSRGELAAGAHVASWDGRDDAGRAVPSGSYLLRLSGAGSVATAKVTLAK